MPIKKEILYPIFLECFEYTTDSFWENIFEDLSYGKCPYGTYINKNFLCCNYKDKEFSYKIEKKNPQQLYNDIYNLFAKKLGLLSSRDKLKKKLDFNNIEEELKFNKNKWTDIRKKNIKDLLIENYVIDMKNKYSLSNKQSKNLLSSIFIGMIFKVINIKDICYNDGKINNINGIQFEKNKVIYEKNIYDFDINFQKCILIDKPIMSENWNKYISNLKKIKK
jgi:hypothetical protein